MRRLENEQAARRLFGDLERVHPVMMNPESIEAHCNRGTRIESAIARQGKLLAGEWTPPRCRIEDLGVVAEDIGDNLDIATGDLRSAFLALCDAAFKGRSYVPNVVEYSQQAAETPAKTILAGFGLSPTAVHDLNALATQLENAYRGRTPVQCVPRRLVSEICRSGSVPRAFGGASWAPTGQFDRWDDFGHARGGEDDEENRTYAGSLAVST